MKLVKFEKTNCTPCKMLDQFVKVDLGLDFDEVINLNQNPDVAMKLGLMSAPVMMLFDKDIDIKKATKEEIEEALVHTVTGQGQSKVREILRKAGKLS